MRVFAYLLLEFCLAFNQRTTDKLQQSYGVVDSIRRIRALIKEVGRLDRKGVLVREAHPLSPPRPDYGVTSADLDYFFQHAYLSSCNPWQLEPNTCYCQDIFSDVKIFRNDTLNSQAAVAVDKVRKLVVVSYRATVNMKNWETNYDMVLVKHPSLPANIKVHRGFLDYVLSLHSQAEPAVRSLLDKNQRYRLTIAGYSLGGAAAALSLPIWIDSLKNMKSYSRPQVFMYSSPRPGSLEFARYLETQGCPLTRYTKKDDVVPHVPDQSMGYSHVGQEFYDDYVDEKSNIRKCARNVVEDPTCSLKDSHFYAYNHFTPFQRNLPVLQTCPKNP